jgi:Methyltransferase domain
VTRRLLRVGAKVTAIEPDSVMVGYLTQSFPDASLDVVLNTFEDVDLEEERFDLAVAATSFHWVDPALGFPKVGKLVRKGGWVALWWTLFYDPDHSDPFRESTCAFLEGEDPDSQRVRSQFQLNEEGRRDDLARRSGLADVSSEVFRWTCQLDTDGVRSLYASMIDIRRRPPPERERLLELIGVLARDQFGGQVNLPFVTVLYTGCRQQVSE